MLANRYRHSTSLQSLANFESPVRGGGLPAFLISGHAQNHDFYGRADILSQIHETFFPTSDSTNQRTKKGLRSVVVCGMGGIGKTEITAEYVFSRKDKFDAVF